jgi:Tfp pilus assembly protein FimT
MSSVRVRSRRNDVSPHLSRVSGFSLVELLVVMVIMMALVAVTIPEIRSLLNRAKLTGAAQEIASVVRVARFEAIRRSCTTVVQVNYANNSLLAFADLNNAAGALTPDLIYNPPTAAQNSTLKVRSYDYTILTYNLPNGVHWWGAADNSPNGNNAVSGFTGSPTSGAPNIAVFNSDGSVQATGAFRIGSGTAPRTVAAGSDNVDNFLAVNVSPLATARIYVTKYNPFVTLDPSLYYEQGQIPTGPGVGTPLWVWY